MSNIPKTIYQTHKSIDYIRNKVKTNLAVKSWLQYTKEFNYYFYNDELCEEFMKNKVGGKTYEAYCRLPMAVMKADLWRYCIIYEYGGIYADTDTVCLVNPNIFLQNSLLNIVPENDVHLCNWIFSAPPKSEILKYVIDLSTERILNIEEIKGEHIIHFLTGPGAFTAGIEKYLYENKFPFFKNKRQYINYQNKQILTVFNDQYFHKNIVKHLFTGQDSDGWTKERLKKLV